MNAPDAVLKRVRLWAEHGLQSQLSDLVAAVAHIDAQADHITALTAERDAAVAENARLRDYWYRQGKDDQHQMDVERIEAQAAEIERLRTYDAHLKGYIECERCCGNGQTYGPNSGGDIICPDCEGTGRHD